MSEIESLWSVDIRPKVLMPVAILRAQAEQLVQQTAGVLTAEIREGEADEEKERVVWNFNFVVPALDNYRQRIMSVAHDKNLPYPAIIKADVFRQFDTFERFLTTGDIFTYENTAKTQDEFIRLLGKVFTSARVVSAAQSLIARASEALANKAETDSQSEDEPSLPALE